MVQSFILEKVLEPVEEFKQQHSEDTTKASQKYESLIKNPLFDALKNYPLQTLNETSHEINCSQNNSIELTNHYSTLTISGEDKQFSHTTIIVPENTSAKLLIKEINPNAYTTISVIIEKNAHLTIGREVYGTTYSSLETYAKENGTCVVVGAYQIAGKESYIFTTGDLIEPHSTIDISMHGIAQEEGKVTNDTTITINHEAPYSNGHQHMKNIIADPMSKVTSKPILEINNNNVECSHGASVSKLSPEIKYYGNTRGINDKELVSLVSQGFFEIISSKLHM